MYVWYFIISSMGIVGFFLAVTITVLPSWKVLSTENTTKYMTGFTEVGLWKMCFPPTIKGPDDYSLHCCHDFRTNEVFFPVEMHVGQTLMIIASVFSFMGVFCFALIEVNVVYGTYSLKKIRCFCIAAGTSYVISSICILVSVSWSVYSVAQNTIIPFLSAFHLPTPVAQRNGGAIVIGYLTAIIFLTCGAYGIGKRSFISAIMLLNRPGRIASTEKTIDLQS